MTNTQKKARPNGTRFLTVNFEPLTKLKGYNVLRLRTFLTLRNVELNLLAFGERFKSRSLDCTKVCKNIRSIFRLNKTEAFRFIEPLYGSLRLFRHNNFLMYLFNDVTFKKT